jgi:hypothetical protein
MVRTYWEAAKVQQRAVQIEARTVKSQHISKVAVTQLICLTATWAAIVYWRKWRSVTIKYKGKVVPVQGQLSLKSLKRMGEWRYITEKQRHSF